MIETTTLTTELSSKAEKRDAAPAVLALVIAWSPSEIGRVGEVAVVPGARDGVTFTLGRGESMSDDPDRKLEFARHRAGGLEARPPLGSATLSRRQLRVVARGATSLTVTNIGRRPLAHNGSRVDVAEVVPGDTLQVGGDLLLLCVKRPAWMHSVGEHPLPMPFGAPDPNGWVGESAAAWDFRRQVAFLAPKNGHVLILGESGSGKEHAAKAIHAGSPRADRPMVARSAATFPEGIVDAEFFGHARNYPNAGMAERPGLIAMAAGTTLFLDEIAELPEALQAHLLRVLDGGEYQRLGETSVRTSDFRLVAATNRPERLRPEVAARFKTSLRVPGLNERIEDIPLLVIHLLRTIARTSPDLAARLFPGGDLTAEPRVASAFVERLVHRVYTTHVRELEGLLWRALVTSPGAPLDGPTDDPRPGSSHATLETKPPPRPARDVSADAIVSALAASDGSVEAAWRALGLGSRHVLTRLMNKYGIRRSRGGQPGPVG